MSYYETTNFSFARWLMPVSTSICVYYIYVIYNVQYVITFFRFESIYTLTARVYGHLCWTKKKEEKKKNHLLLISFLTYSLLAFRVRSSGKIPLLFFPSHRHKHSLSLPVAPVVYVYMYVYNIRQFPQGPYGALFVENP